ncbi:unnamed protein product [Hydatigera taeniaeformis]|uniref:Anaphase-promoting complex subunit 1 n=1 Tax=Hydatigena taeniaeformis TaxID=6205 RepID=A0A0R3WZG1_HYDTA|nr:unnamed protein product [Hydatigera taeniaeformis]
MFSTSASLKANYGSGLQAAAQDPVNCALTALQLTELDAASFEATYQLVVEAAKSGSLGPTHLFSAARHLDARGYPLWAFPLTVHAMRLFSLSGLQESHPVAHDVLWSCLLAHRIGLTALQEILSHVVRNVHCPTLLADILHRCRAPPPPPPPPLPPVPLPTHQYHPHSHHHPSHHHRVDGNLVIQSSGVVAFGRLEFADSLSCTKARRLSYSPTFVWYTGLDEKTFKESVNGWHRYRHSAFTPLWHLTVEPFFRVPTDAPKVLESKVTSTLNCPLYGLGVIAKVDLTSIVPVASLAMYTGPSSCLMRSFVEILSRESCQRCWLPCHLLFTGLLTNAYAGYYLTSKQAQPPLLPVDAPPLKPLLEATISAFVATTHARLANISPRQYADFLDFLSRARDTFCLLKPDGPAQFRQLVSCLCHSYRGKRKLIALLNERFHHT